MALLNLGYGLAAMGGAMSQTGGAMALEAQKANLEAQKVLLANQLQEGSETRLAGVKAGYESQLQGQKQKGAVELAKTQSQLSVEAQGQIAKNAAALAETLGSDPKYIAAQKALNSADPEKMARAALEQQQAALYATQDKSAIQAANIRGQIIDEQSKPKPDQNKLNSLTQNLMTLLADPNARATLVTAMVSNARVNEDAASRAQMQLNQATAELEKADPNDPDYPSLKANAAMLKIRLNSLNKAADDSSRLAKEYLGGRSGITTPAPSNNRPDLGTVLGMPGAAPKPVAAPTPAPITAPNSGNNFTITPPQQ